MEQIRHVTDDYIIVVGLLVIIDINSRVWFGNGIFIILRFILLEMAGQRKCFFFLHI
jgi:hypothetical protein